MNFKTIDFQKNGYVGTLQLFSPPANQGEMVQLSYELSEIFSSIRSDQDIRIVKITGKKKDAFSMGHITFISSPGMELNLPAKTISEFDLPVIGEIKGDAIGLGLELVLACDLRFATTSSCFGLPQIREGSIPWNGGTQRLSRLVGRGKALEMILTGESIDASEALRFGLINRIFPEERLSEEVTILVNEIASKGPIATKYAKEAVNKGLDITLDQGLRLEADLYFLLHTTQDRTEGIRAFQEKREAKFQGK
jgi:enoyl-CoA hydratase/carnithine racemase